MGIPPRTTLAPSGPKDATPCDFGGLAGAPNGVDRYRPSKVFTTATNGPVCRLVVRFRVAQLGGTPLFAHSAGGLRPVADRVP